MALNNFPIRSSLSCFVWLLLISVISGCQPQKSQDPVKDDQLPPVVMTERYFTPRDTVDNVDSPAVWHSDDGNHWLLATAKETDVVLVFDASSGELIDRVGGSGAGPGMLERPNGIAVINNIALVVERDNARVQVFSLPAFTTLGFIGETELIRPYGLAVYQDSAGSYVLYVTDNYETADEQVPPDKELGQRVKKYRFHVSGDSVGVEHEKSFGDVAGDGMLRVVESLAIDQSNNLILIAEEDEAQSMLKGYALDGQYVAQSIDARYFPNQAEGIVLYTCGEHDGYWVATDQADEKSIFNVFDRRSLAFLGAFQGEVTANTDGIALSQQTFSAFPNGGFWAVHDDGSVAAFDWGEIAKALNLRSDCRAS